MLGRMIAMRGALTLLAFCLLVFAAALATRLASLGRDAGVLA
jgi:hypothetical protein